MVTQGPPVSFYVFLAFNLLVVGFFVAVGWKLYQKAGEPGWAVLVPVYNALVLLRIVGRPAWWLILLITPAALIINFDLAKSFGKDWTYGLGITFLGFIFLPMLAFGSATYEGPAAAESATQSTGG